MASLVNDTLMRTSIIQQITSVGNIVWFKGITVSDVIVSIILPLIVAIIVAFVLKGRYNKYLEKRELGLTDISTT